MLLDNFTGQSLSNFEEPTLLFDNGMHSVFWLGYPEETAFRTNTYLLRDKDEFIVVDPGASGNFEFIKRRINQIANVSEVCAIILCHQDPDVASSLPNWLDIKPDLKVITSHRTEVLLPYYTKKEMNTVIISDDFRFSFSSGNRLRFVEAPFLHFPGAFATYDPVSNFLFSGDVFAALDYDWKLVIDEFETHAQKMDLFHKDYMASNKATKGFAEKCEALKINAILPQHGSIIPEPFVKHGLAYLKELQCGTDLIYPD